MIEVHAESGVPGLIPMLSRHPRVASVSPATTGISFSSNGWHRELRIADRDCELAGLVELMDNNPLVCADVVSVLPANAVLPTIAVGPLAQAGLLVEAPTVMTSLETDEEDLAYWLTRSDWRGGVTVSHSELELGTVVAVTVIAAITTPPDPSDIDDLFEERYGRSFFIQRNETDPWDTKLVQGANKAVYRLRWTPDEPHSLLTIQLMADLNGKLGAGQLVHCFNVMNGFEESLALE